MRARGARVGAGALAYADVGFDVNLDGSGAKRDDGFAGSGRTTIGRSTGFRADCSAGSISGEIAPARCSAAVAVGRAAKA